LLCLNIKMFKFFLNNFIARMIELYTIQVLENIVKREIVGIILTFI